MNGRIVDSTGFSKTEGAVRRIVRLNIGLNNNPFDVADIMYAVGFFMKIDSHSIEDGEYEGHDEPTLVVTGLTDYQFDDLKDILTALAFDLTQDCIAFKYGGKGDLAYRSDWTGDKYEFDEQYFI